MKLPRLGWCWLLILTCFQVSADTKTLSQWIDYFADSGINVFYSSDYLSAEQLNQPISLANNQFNEFNRYFADTGLSLQSVDETIYVLRPKQAEQFTTILVQAYDVLSLQQIKKFQLSNNQQVNINSSAGAIVLQQLTGEKVEFTVKASGYEDKIISEPLTPNTSLHLNLTPLPLALADILVSTSQINFNASGVSQQTLSRQDLAKQVSFNHDPLRAAESLAGTASNGLSGKTHTRGGSENEVLVVFDNRELRNPYHFKDFFSVFSTINDSVVDAISFYSGVFPVQYGGRLSSVLDVQSNEMNAVPNHDVNIGLLTSSYTYRHNNPAQDRHYLMALRTGGQFFNDSLVEELTIHPEYDDGYFKAVQQLNDRWQSSQHFLLSRDEIDIDQDEEVAQAEYHDQNLWLQWAYDDLNSHQMNWQLYGSRRNDRRQGWLADENSLALVDESIQSRFIGVKFEHQWDVTDQLLFDYGIDLADEQTTLASMRQIDHFSDLTQALGLSRQVNREFELDQEGTSAQVYANVRYQFNAKWTMDLGFHYQHQSWLANSGLSPRFNLAYFMSNQTTWRFGLGRHQQKQHIDELMLEEIEPRYFEPAAADLAVIEFNHRLNNGWHFRSEIYFKKYSQTHPYYENLFNGFHILPDLFYDRIRLAPDDAEAAGAEFTLNGKYRHINWSASYTYSDVTDEFDDIEISRSWNQRNAIKLNMSLPIKSWLFNMNIDFNNGWPLTRIITTDGEYSIDQRNQGHFKDFYQLSFKLNKSWQSDWGLWQVEMQLANAFNIVNPCCRNYQLTDGVLSFAEKKGLPLVPNLRIGFSWD